MNTMLITLIVLLVAPHAPRVIVYSCGSNDLRPGQVHHNHGMGCDLAGRVMEMLSGKRVFCLMREHLFDPLGLSQTTLEEDLGFSCFSTAADFAKRHQLLLNRGTCGGLVFLSSLTLDHLLPEPLSRHYPAITIQSWGIGLSWTRQPHPEAGTNGIPSEATGLSRQVIGHGSATSAILPVDLDNELVTPQTRRRGGPEFDRHLAKLLVALEAGLMATDAAPSTSVISAQGLRKHAEAFSSLDEELYPQAIRNADAAAYLEANAPRFECPDAELERTYWFRWWTYRKHLRQTPEGYVITEFLPPVPWAGKYNTISCAAGHHLREGRWLHDQRPLDDYSRFWFRPGSEPRKYSFWAADSILAQAAVTGDTRLARELLPGLIRNYEGWERERFDAAIGLFWQEDGQDGMEVSVGGSGFRATINSYLYGEALAIARIADLDGKPAVAARFRERAAALKRRVLEKLWDPRAAFFKVLPRDSARGLAEVRELHGFTPWYTGLADPAQAEAWRQFTDPQGFQAPHGLTTAEQRHPGFTLSYTGHECQWNGPSWPYATAVTLSAAANLLQGPTQSALTKVDYFEALLTYSRAHRLTRDDGRVVPWIDENLHPHTGDWIARTRLKSWENGTWSEAKGGRERGKDYNHSTFNDLVITGLVGLRPRLDETVEVHPLVPDGVWDYYALDRVPYHGRVLTILWDRTGERYRRGPGLQVLVDGRVLAATNRLARIQAVLPPR